MTTPFPFTSGATLTAQQLNDITNLPINDQTASYSAVVGDVGKRIVMDVATANTVTIDDAIFAVGDTIFIANKGAGATTVTAGVGVTINTSGSLVLAQFGGGTLVALSASVFTFFSGGGGNPYGTATGGTTITPWSVSTKNYNGMKFTADGTLTVTKAGLFDVIIQSGGFGGNGGGGGNSAANKGGGSTAGQMIQTTIFLTATTHAIRVGAGNAGQASHILGPVSTSQISSIGSSVFACGGGTGAGYVFGGNGGSWVSSSVLALSGGNALGTGSTSASGGGAGVIGAGGNAVGTTGGAGGTGFEAADFNGGVSLGIGGGGSGGSATGAAGAATSGGGTGGLNAVGGNGTANTGGGGGGGVSASPFASVAGGNGGSGIVFVRFEV